MAEIIDCTEAEYHADPCESPSLSASLAHTIVAQSALHAWWSHPKLGGQPPEESDCKRLGRARHDYLLNDGKGLAVIDATDWRTKDAREERDRWLDDGRIPLHKGEYQALIETMSMARDEVEAIRDDAEWRAEQTIIWHDAGVLCRSRIDLLSNTGVIIDVKTVRNAQPDAVSRAIWTYGMDIQAHAYMTAAAKLWPDRAGRIQYRWLIVETEPPYIAYMAKPDATVLHYGQRRWERARDTWSRCLETNNWPGYRAQILSIPEWAAARYDIQEMTEDHE